MTKITKVKPLGHRVLVKLQKIEEQLEEKSESGIVLAIRTKSEVLREQDAHVRAFVVDIGKTANKYLDSHDGSGECEYKVGDMVLIGMYAGNIIPDVFDKNEVYRIIKDVDIHALIEEVEVNE